MKKQTKWIVGLVLVGLVCSLMAGCQRDVFGVDEQVWNTLSAEERKQVIEGHNKEKEEREKNAHIHEMADLSKRLIELRS